MYKRMHMHWVMHMQHPQRCLHYAYDSVCTCLIVSEDLMSGCLNYKGHVGC